MVLKSDPKGIQASPGKVRAIIEWPRPKSVHDVRSFLGLASYYRRFVRAFSKMARPLTQMTRAGVEWDWSEAQHQAFNRLKLALTTAPVLKLPDFDRQFVVTIDASDAAVGVIFVATATSGPNQIVLYADSNACDHSPCNCPAVSPSLGTVQPRAAVTCRLLGWNANCIA